MYCAGDVSLLTPACNLMFLSRQATCSKCGEGGALICCDYCPASFHMDPCLELTKVRKRSPRLSKSTFVAFWVFPKHCSVLIVREALLALGDPARIGLLTFDYCKSVACFWLLQKKCFLAVVPKVFLALGCSQGVACFQLFPRYCSLLVVPKAMLAFSCSESIACFWFKTR